MIPSHLTELGQQALAAVTMDVGDAYPSSDASYWHPSFTRR